MIQYRDDGEGRLEITDENGRHYSASAKDRAAICDELCKVGRVQEVLRRFINQLLEEEDEEL